MKLYKIIFIVVTNILNSVYSCSYITNSDITSQQQEKKKIQIKLFSVFQNIALWGRRRKKRRMT